MDEFLKVVYNAHVETYGISDKSYDELYKPFLNRLKEIVSQKLYEELEELFTGCTIENNIYYGVEGMKLAMSIMEKKYIPQI